MTYSKLITSGNYVELFQYEKAPRPKFKRTVFKQRDKEELDTDQLLQRRMGNIIRARRNFFRLIHANLKPDEKPVFITLTTINQNSLSIAYTYLTKFITRLRKIYGKQFRCISVPEFQTRGAVHFHCLFWGLPILDIFNEIPWSVRQRQRPKVLERFLAFCNEHKFEPTKARGDRKIQHQWMRGFLDCLPTDGHPKLATYMAKYMRKAMSDRRLYQSKSHVCSRNALRPMPEKGSSINEYLFYLLKDRVPTKVKKYDTQWLGNCTYTVYDDSQEPPNPKI